jgi:hypothetical protein
MRRAYRYLLPFVALAFACTSPTEPTVVGTWGGTSVSLELDSSGGTLQYMCGNGTIDPGWSLAPDGTFTATGLHYYGGGPLPSGGRTPHPASYTGHVAGNHMTLTVTVTDTDAVLGPFDLVRNGPTVFEVCV